MELPEDGEGEGLFEEDEVNSPIASKSRVPASGFNEDNDDEWDRDAVKDMGLRMTGVRVGVGVGVKVGEPIFVGV